MYTTRVDGPLYTVVYKAVFTARVHGRGAVYCVHGHFNGLSTRQFYGPCTYGRVQLYMAVYTPVYNLNRSRSVQPFLPAPVGVWLCMTVFTSRVHGRVYGRVRSCIHGPCTVIEMPFELWTQVGQRKHVLDGNPDPHAKGQFLKGKNTPGHARRHCAVSCEKWLNRSRCRLVCGLGWAQGCMYYMVVPIGATWRIRWNHSCSGGPNRSAAVRLYFDHLLMLMSLSMSLTISMSSLISVPSINT